MEEKITISVKEYAELLEVSLRVKIFSNFVNNEKYSISKEDCGNYLGFDVVESED